MGTYVISRDVVRHVWLLAASWLFYAAWDARFLALFMATIVVSWVAAIWIARADNPSRRSRALAVAIALLLGNLGLFKYFDFFSRSFVELAEPFGLDVDPIFLNVILPIGISFYTFQAISYCADVHARRLAPERSFLIYAVYLSLFPHVVAGPIVRAIDLLPQLNAKWRAPGPEEVASAMARFTWGLFKKAFIADRLAATIVDPIFAAPAEATGGAVILAIFCFGLMIYADFSGYSDMAIALARLLGYRFKENFRAPYWAASPRELWRRWHITLSEWIRDYVYIPLGGGRTTTRPRSSVNAFIAMTLCGLWHGANPTFALWGAWHGLLLIADRSLGRKTKQGRTTLSRCLGWAATSVGIYLGWALFRAPSWSDFTTMLGRILETGLTYPAVGDRYLISVALMTVVVYAEQAVIDRWPRLLTHENPRVAMYLHTICAVVLAVAMLVFFRPEVGCRNFVYFQF